MNEKKYYYLITMIQFHYSSAFIFAMYYINLDIYMHMLVIEYIIIQLLPYTITD